MRGLRSPVDSFGRRDTGIPPAGYTATVFEAQCYKTHYLIRRAERGG